MHIKKLLTLSIFLFGLIGLIIIAITTHQSPTIATDNSPNNKIEFLEVEKTNQKTSVKIKYHLSAKQPILIINCPQINNLDTDKLKKDIGADNVGLNSDEQNVYLNLKNHISPQSSGELNLEILSKAPTVLQFKDIGNNKLAEKAINPEKTKVTDTSSNNTEPDEDTPNEQESNQSTNPEDETANEEPVKETATDSETVTDISKREDPDSDNPEDSKPDDEDSEIEDDQVLNDDEEDVNSGWNQSDRLGISTGKPVETLDPDSGEKKIAYPVIYFGALNYALGGGIKISDSLSTDRSGHGRKNNITAANSAIILTKPDGDPNDIQRDTDYNDKKATQRNRWYTSTYGDGLMTYDKSIIDNDNQKQTEFGSQRNFTTTNLNYYAERGLPGVNSVKRPDLFGPGNIDKNKKKMGMDTSSFKFYWKKDPVTTLTEQRIVFKQSHSKKSIKISTTQRFGLDGSIIITTEFKNVGKERIPEFTGYTFRDVTFMKDHRYETRESKNVLRSLGDNRGVYATRQSHNGSIEFHLTNFEDSPYAWSARGTKSSYFQSSNEHSFPFNTRSKEIFGKSDSFNDIYDKGDNGRDPGLGKAFAGKGVSWESGISMHTENQSLGVGKTVSMTYSTSVVPISSDPMIDVHQKGTVKDPIMVDPSKKLKLNGSWFYLGSTRISINCLVDAKETDPEKLKHQIMEPINKIADYRQSDYEQSKGIRKPWKHEIDISNLSAGIHTIYFAAKDEVGKTKTSPIKKVVIKIPRHATKKPQIEIDSPVESSSKDDPFDPEYNDGLNLKGSWSDADSKNVDLTYQLDDGQEMPIGENKTHKNILGVPMPWHINNLSIMHINDVKVHKIDIKINDGNDTVIETFYFQKRNGAPILEVPANINFGSNHIIPNKDQVVTADVSGPLRVNDFRGVSNKALKISLQVKHFNQSTFDEDSGKDNTKTLTSSLSLDGQKIPFNTPVQIGPDLYTEDGVWKKTTVLSHKINDKIKLKIHGNNHDSNGDFSSQWFWTASDTI